MDKLFQKLQLIHLIKPIPSINSCLLITLLITSGCAQVPQVNEPYTFFNQQAPYRSAILFAQEFPNLSLEEQRTRVILLNRADPQDLIAKLELAIAYGLPSSRVRDHAKAQSLVDELIKDTSLDHETIAFLSLLNEYMTEVSKSNQKIKDEQKRAESTQLKHDDVQKKLEAMQKKLDDLKKIEKTLIDRERGVKK